MYKHNRFLLFVIVFTKLLTGCSYTLHPISSKKIRQNDIGYSVIVSDDSYGNQHIETKILVRNELRFVELAAPSYFKIDDTELLLFWDPKNPDSKNYYVNPIRLGELKCGMHTFTFMDLDKRTYTDSFWYCRPTLQTQTLQWLDDNTIKINVTDDLKTDTMYFYLGNKKSGASTASKVVVIKNGTAIIDLSKINADFKMMLQNDYQLFAYCAYNKNLQRGTITVRTDAASGVSLKSK